MSARLEMINFTPGHKKCVLGLKRFVTPGGMK